VEEWILAMGFGWSRPVIPERMPKPDYARIAAASGSPNSIVITKSRLRIESASTDIYLP
jgi:hypothetical protein